QQKTIATINQTLNNKQNALIHAPTGSGKTIAALYPTLQYAKTHQKKVFFLTSRQTQHIMARQTAQKLHVRIVDMVGKQHMCIHDDVLAQQDFYHACRFAREKGKCSYFKHIRKQEHEAEEYAQATQTIDPKDAIQIGYQQQWCPYEFAALAARQTELIIGDYSYIFHDRIRDTFLKRIQTDSADCIVIIDEAHNLGKRIKEWYGQKLSTFMLRRAIEEANEPIADLLRNILYTFEEFIDQNDIQERVVPKDFFTSLFDMPYNEALKMLYMYVAQQENKQSYIHGVAQFMESWTKYDTGFTRIFGMDYTRKQPTMQLSLKCLDPAIISEPIVESCHSVIGMSATLLPLQMYQDTLGMGQDAQLLLCESNFPTQNALHIVCPSITTKFSTRTTQEYEKIAQLITNALRDIPGNTVIFFPSYALQQAIGALIQTSKTVFWEKSGFDPTQRALLLEQFKSQHQSGGVLYAVASGSFGEGIDLPGEFLQGVIIVGLPLAKPNLEMQQLIAYYQEVYGRGWEYGYIYPALNTIMQNAGRCIRSETDKGVIIYMDERFLWGQYKQCFSPDMNIIVSQDLQEISEFFDM
ncbi:MAG: ATP-dependent DNA helicase, partial [Candidatus Woesearchaeota archaeon]